MTLRIVLPRACESWRAGLLTIAQGFFLIAGALALGYVGGELAGQHVYQARESREFDQAIQAIALRQSGNRSTQAYASPAKAGAGLARSLVGKIEIPRLHISAMVKEGVDSRTLGLAVGHIPYTPLPGQDGNVGVAAHRDSLFRNLKDVRRDDRITVTTLDGEYNYRVVSYKIVEPSEISVLDPRPNQKMLTLVTCYPFYFVGNAPKRFIVHAVQVF